MKKPSWKIGDRARVNYSSYSNFDSNRERVGVVVEIEDDDLTVEFNDEFTPSVLKDPDMKRDVLRDHFEAFDKVEG